MQHAVSHLILFLYKGKKWLESDDSDLVVI